MKVTVVGKRHLAGKSRKTGYDFDNNIVFVTMKQKGVEGLSVDSLWLEADEYPLATINVGAVYDVDRDSRGYIIGFTPAAPAAAR